jgi:small multidrug resistance pump
MRWVLLSVAIVAEVSGTLSLRLAAAGAKIWYGVVVTGYLLAFTFLSLALAEGLGLGVAYGTWAAAGVALTAVASRFLFGERLGVLMGCGIACIAAGVLLVEVGH